MYPIKEIDDVFLAFPANVRDMMPEYKDIPDEFSRSSNKWNALVSRWFFSGLPDDAEFQAKEGVDARKALRHIRAILGSFQPKHEHKEAACAFLLNEWFDDYTIPAKAAKP